MSNERAMPGGGMVGTPVEPERPGPKFEVGQWVESDDGPKGVVESFSDVAVVVRNPYNPAPCSEKNMYWSHPVCTVRPCSPVCTEAQLAIRVGDEVRVAHHWRHDGRPHDGRDKYEGKTGKATMIAIEGFIIVTVVSADIPAEKFCLWNLEPVKPRA